ncbi:hypothetical protein MSG28_003344 [Choristoneura fumiferana]|uniref:Uncharacterized protein n=1 Tax=Choristoneura fumiferana TaxID=7141 RepID=A0ACC0KEF6_CHOFU|nr:hypothetical protein MSG28_003344 [Choristoneura fumiferana]
MLLLVSDLRCVTNRNGDSAKKVETRRIFLGVQAEIKDWPFVVSIHIAGKFVCTGSIIREDLVLSAGSCFIKFYKKKLKKEFKNNIWIRAGSNYFNSGGVTVRAVMLHFYPKFNPVERSNNIVVIQLKLKLRYKNQLIKAIKFAKKRTKYTGVDILGWGNKEASMEGRNQRVMYDVDVDMNIENQQLQRAVLDRYSMIDCISVYPSVIGIELHGVVSFGPTRNGTHAAPIVFSKVFKYARWLNKLFRKITLTNDTVEDSGQMETKVKQGSGELNVLYTDESYIVSEIKNNIQASYRNLLDLYLPIEEDHTQILHRQSNQYNSLRNNIYLDPTLVNSTEVFEKLNGKNTTPTKTDQVSNWVLYKEFMAQILNNKSNDPAAEAFGVTEGNLAQSTAAEKISLLSEMQEEYDAEYSEQKVESEYNGITHNMPNNDENKAQTQKDTLSDSNDDRNKPMTQNVEFEYEDTTNSTNNHENIIQKQNVSPNDSENDKNKPQTQNVEFVYEDTPYNDENKGIIENYSPNDPNDDKDKPLTHNVEFQYENTPNDPNNDGNKAQIQNDLPNDHNNGKDESLTQNVQFEYEDAPNNDNLVKQDANDLAEIIISDSGTTQKLSLNKKDPEAVKRFVNELIKLKDRITRTSTTIFYRELDEIDK